MVGVGREFVDVASILYSFLQIPKLKFYLFITQRSKVRGCSENEFQNLGIEATFTFIKEFLSDFSRSQLVWFIL